MLLGLDGHEEGGAAPGRHHLVREVHRLEAQRERTLLWTEMGSTGQTQVRYRTRSDAGRGQMQDEVRYRARSDTGRTRSDICESR